METGDNLTNGDAGVLSSPLSFHRSGYFSWRSSDLGYRGSRGYYWSDRAYSTSNSRYLSFFSTNLNPQDGYFRGSGFAVRCVEKQLRNAFRAKKVQLDCFSGSHSFQNLFVGEMGMENSGDNRDSGTISNPFSFSRSGYFGWSSSGLNFRGSYGGYWSGHTYSTNYSHYLYFYSTYLNPQDGSRKGNGFAVRCVLTKKKSPFLGDLIINWHLASFPLLQYDRPYQA